MTKEELYKSFLSIDDEVLERSERPAKKGIRPWMKWMACACVILLIWQSGILTELLPSPDVAYGITINGNDYKIINYSEREFYDLMPAALHPARKKDLGEVLGVVENGPEELVGTTAYHYAAYPDTDDICIVKVGRKYEFYTMVGPYVPSEIGQNYQAVLDACRIPDSILEISVTNYNRQEIMLLKESDAIQEMCELLGECVNQGPDMIIYDKDFLRDICIQLNNGDRVEIQYYSDIDCFVSYGYYHLSQEAADRLDEILQIP